MADHLSMMESGEPAKRIAFKFLDVSLFMVNIQPKEDWRLLLMKYLTHK